jgi:hypothetical protein
MNINLQPVIYSYPHFDDPKKTHVALVIWDRNDPSQIKKDHYYWETGAEIMLATDSIPEESARAVTAQILMYLAHKASPETFERMVKLGNTDFTIHV